jgi:hypothetical protein
MKGILITIVVIGAAVAAEEQHNFSHYTDGALSMLRQIQRSFGFQPLPLELRRLS